MCVCVCVCVRVRVQSLSPDSLWPHGLQPTRLLCPWDFPGKNTGVDCYSLLQGIFPTQGSNESPALAGRFFTTEPLGKPQKDYSVQFSSVTQSCPTRSDPMDCSPPGSFVHGIFQARVLEWGAIAFSVQSDYTILILLSAEKQSSYSLSSLLTLSVVSLNL